MLAQLIVLAAHAGTDAHGLVLPGSDDVADPLAVWRPEVQVPGAWSVSGSLEEAQGLLTAYAADASGTVTQTDLVADLTAFNLGAHLAVARRFAVALSAPTWLTSGSATDRRWLGLGDLRLAAPVGLVLPARDGTGFGLSVVPHLDAPTGDTERYLGSGALGGGGVVALGVGWRGFAIASNLGAESVSADALLLQEAGAALLGSVATTWSPSRRFALHLEGLARYGVAPGLEAQSLAAVSAARCLGAKTADLVDCGDVAAAQQVADKPAEVLINFDWGPAPGLVVGAGGALGLTSAVGAPTWRGFLIAGWTTGKEKPDRSTTTDTLSLDATITDLAYDGTGSGAVTATVRPDAAVTVRAQTWLDRDDLVLARGATLTDVPAGPYTLEVRYHDGERVQTERHVLDVGYEVRWLPVEGAQVSEDGRMVDGMGGVGIARSYNRAGPDDEAWVEIGDGTGGVGLSTAHAWPSAAPDAGWTGSARSDGGPAATVGDARVTRSGDSVTWTDGDLTAEGTVVEGPVVAVAVVEGAEVVTGARASFHWSVAEPGPSCTPVGAGDLLGAPEGPLCAPPAEIDALRIVDASGDVVATIVVEAGMITPARLAPGMAIELLREGVVVATSAVLP